MGNYRYQITAAVAWQIIYQIMRRYHHKYSLRILETHPCSGQYDCLSVYTVPQLAFPESISWTSTLVVAGYIYGIVLMVSILIMPIRMI